MDKMHIRTDKRANQKIKLTGICRLLIFAAAIQSLSGCVKDDLHNTPHPDRGAVKVTTNWTGHSSDATMPDNYILRIGSEEQTVSGETNAFNVVFPPGKQDLLAYNRADGITVSGTTAAVNTLPDGTLEPMPGHLFSGTQELDLVPDDTLRVIQPMRQHTRSLTLTLGLADGDKERIASARGTLTGIAQSLDLTTGKLTEGQTGGTVALEFKISTVTLTRAESKPVLVATLRLIGVVEGEHILTLTVTMVDGTVHTATTDLTESLKNLGSSMEPLALDAALTLPIAGEAGGTITGWQEVDNGNITIQQ